MYRPIMLLFTWACYADDWSNTATTRKKYPISKNRNNVLQTRILIWNIFLYQTIHNYILYIRPTWPGRVDSGRHDPRPTWPGFSDMPVLMAHPKCLLFFFWGGGEHGGLVVNASGLWLQRSGVRVPLGSNRVVSLSKAHLLPKSTGNTQEAVATSQHDWKIVYQDIKNQSTNQMFFPFC